MSIALPFETREQLPLRKDSKHVQFTVNSTHSFPIVLGVFLQWLKTEFSIFPKSDKRKLFDPTHPAVLSILRSTIPLPNKPCQGLNFEEIKDD